MKFPSDMFGNPGNEPERNFADFWRLFAPSGKDATPTHVSEIPCAVEFNPNFYYFAGRNIGMNWASKHNFIQGSSGTGKTTAIKLCIQSVIHRIRIPGPPTHLIISDPKCDIIPFLAGLGFHPEDADVFILNPHDLRSAVWKLNEPMKEPANVRYIAEELIPNEKQSTAPFFADASRELLIGTTIGLNAGRGKDSWDLRDLLLALSSRENIRAVSSHHPRAKELCERILMDERNSDGVISQLGAKLGKFESVAALWDTAKQAKRFSVSEFLKKSGVLVIGNDPVLKPSLVPITSLLMKNLADNLLRLPDTQNTQHFMFFDELRNLGKQTWLHDLMTMGRSKGVSVTIGVQSLEGLYEIYQKDPTNDMIGQCATKVFLRAGGPETANWAESYFNKTRSIERSCTESSSGTRSVQYSLQDRPMFLATRFLNMPFPEVDGNYTSISDVPSHNCVFISRRNFSEMLSWLKKPSDIPALAKREVLSDQILRPWTPEERAKFCGDEASATKAKSSNAAGSKPYLPARRRKPPEDPSQGELFPPNS